MTNCSSEITANYHGHVSMQCIYLLSLGGASSIKLAPVPLCWDITPWVLLMAGLQKEELIIKVEERLSEKRCHKAPRCQQCSQRRLSVLSIALWISISSKEEGGP